MTAVLLMQGCVGGSGGVSRAPVLNEGAPTAIAGGYIVVFRERTGSMAATSSRAVRDPAAAALSRSAQDLVRRLGGQVTHEYTAALTGFSARLTPAALEALRRHPGVAWIQADRTITLDIPQNPAPTGIDRTSERLLPLDNTYTHHPNESGAGVHVYIVDTGTRATHDDFGPGTSRVTGGATVVGGNQLTDCNGHGTHVAGTVGGRVHGIAKNVNLHPVKVFPACSGSTATSDVIAGIDWVAANAVVPAVANLSLGGGIDPAEDLAVTNTIAGGVTFVVAAGNDGVDACNVSPARVPGAITVGATNPNTDLRWVDIGHASNIGTCIDLFAPGEDITSAWGTSNTATLTIDGTSMASPHVAGVAARYLTTHPTATPANVWSAILAAANVTTDPNYTWTGIANRGAGSPNVLLHWGSYGDDGYTDGEPHLRTVDGLYYDFQAAGEFVLLREDAGAEIQVRQAPVSTSFRPGPGSFGLSSCVSVNTAVAARVGGHRVTFQPDLSGVPSPTGLQLRVDGAVRPLTPAGLPVGPGRVSLSGANGMQVDFPDGTILVATPGFWSSQNIWYLQIGVLNTRATQGLIGRRSAGGWLPALPDGSSPVTMPGTPHDRYVALYQRFGNAWRVTNRTSLFDYRPGTSTATFTLRSWPTESGSCIVPRMPRLPPPLPPSAPAEPRRAQEACRGLDDRHTLANCEFDVTATGDPEFARTYLLAERVRAGLLRDRQRDDRPDVVTTQTPRPAPATD